MFFVCRNRWYNPERSATRRAATCSNNSHLLALRLDSGGTAWIRRERTVIPALLRIALAQRDSEDNEMVNDMFVAMCFPTTRRESRHLNTRKPLSRPGDPNPTLLQCSRVTTVEPRADGVRNI